MQMLYDSDAFVVVHMQANEPLDGEPKPVTVRHGFEIVDKRSNKEVIWTVHGPTHSSVRSLPGNSTPPPRKKSNRHSTAMPNLRKTRW